MPSLPWLLMAPWSPVYFVVMVRYRCLAFVETRRGGHPKAAPSRWGRAPGGAESVSLASSALAVAAHDVEARRSVHHGHGLDLDLGLPGDDAEDLRRPLHGLVGKMHDGD